MMTGLYPFTGSKSEFPQRDTIFEAILSDPPDFSVSIPAECLDLLARMLDKKTETRYDVYGVLAHEWCSGLRYLYIPPDVQRFLDSTAGSSPCEVCNPVYAKWLSRVHANSILRYVKKYSYSIEAH